MSDLDAIVGEISAECSSLGISVAGGHTEVAPIERTILSSTMIGILPRERLARRPPVVGDPVLLTKAAGIEGTSIIASEMGEKLQGSVGPGSLARAKAFSSRISIVDEAMALADERVKRMHDPTEGGVLGGLLEMCTATGATLEVRPDRIPVEPETLAICRGLGIDPLRLMGSGALLSIAPKDAVTRSVRKLRRLGIPVARIGEVKATGKAELYLKTGSDSEKVEDYPTDELWGLISGL